MCQLTAPPTAFLAGPLQVPLGWLIIAGVLAAAGVGVPANYRLYLRRYSSALYRRVGVTLLGGAALLVCTGMVLLVLVVFPSKDALSAWLASQGATLTASHCADTDSTALLDTYERQLNGPIATWQLVAFVFLCVGVGVEFIIASFFRLSRRLRAQPPRQLRATHG